MYNFTLLLCFFHLLLNLTPKLVLLHQLAFTMKKIIFITIIFFTASISAQFTELINSNRPGFSESPYGVGTKVYQLESGFFYEKTQPIPTFSRPVSSGMRFALRTSFLLEKLEFNSNVHLQRDKTYFKNIFESDTGSSLGLSKFNFGAKYLVYEPKFDDKSKEIRSWKRRMGFDWKRLIPSAAAYLGVNFGSSLNDYYEKGGVTPKIGVLLQNNITSYFNVITNFYYDYAFSDYAEYVYLLTGTYTYTDRISWFIEAQKVTGKQVNRNALGGGFAYLFNRNLQLDVSVGFVTNYQAKGFNLGIGASYRIDRHVDDYKEFDEKGEEIEKTAQKYKRIGLFSKLFGKVKGVFKKKDKSLGGDEKGNTVTKKARKRERKKAYIGELKKLDEKETRKLEREERKKKKKAARDAKRKAKKEKKAARDAKKAEEREKRRLEKEIKKAEQDVKDEEKRLQKEKERERKRLEKEKKEKEKREKEKKEKKEDQ